MEFTDFDKQKRGSSDIAALTLRGYTEENGVTLELLRFGGDGSFTCHIVPAGVQVPEYYKLQFTFQNWLDVIDDDDIILKLRTKKYNDNIKVYRAGEMAYTVQGDFEN